MGCIAGFLFRGERGRAIAKRASEASERAGARHSRAECEASVPNPLHLKHIYLYLYIPLASVSLMLARSLRPGIGSLHMHPKSVKPKPKMCARPSLIPNTSTYIFVSIYSARERLAPARSLASLARFAVARPRSPRNRNLNLRCVRVHP